MKEEKTTIVNILVPKEVREATDLMDSLEVAPVKINNLFEYRKEERRKEEQTCK